MRPALLSSTISRSVARLPQTTQCVATRNIITTSSARFTFKASAIKNNPILAQMLISKSQVRYFSSPVLLQMPALSPTMESGKILTWKKKEGDQIQPGDVICEIETDKSAMAFEATDEGYLAKILIPDETEGVKIGQTIAVVVEDKADIGKYKDYTPESEGEKTKAKPEEKSEEKPSSSSSADEKNVETAEKKAESAPAPKSSGRVMSSPAARAQAAQNNIDISTLKGTGPGNRVVKADVLEAISSKSAQQQQPAAAAKAETAKAAPKPAAPIAGASYTDIPNSTIRKVTASRLTQSKQQVPHYYLTQQCKVDSLLKLREQLNKKAKNGEYKLSINDFVIKASALALKKIPTVNSTWNDTFIRQFHTVDINVAINTEHGLFTPLIPNTDAKGLSEISKSVKDLADKAKINKLTPTESLIGGFTISNLGMFGITHFEAVINPPQAAILAVGGVDQKVSVSTADDGSQTFSVDNVMNVTLSCDHRVVDGAIGAQWLQAFKQYIEDPISMLL